MDKFLLKLFNIFSVLLLVFIMGVFLGENIVCKKLGLKYSWDYGCIKE